MTADELEKVLETYAQQTSGPHWTSYIAMLLAILGAYLAYRQLSKIADQIADAREAMSNDHDRSRRECTVAVLKYYQEATKPEHNKMVKLLDLMPEEQLVCLRDAKPISLASEMKELACSALRSTFPNIYEEYCKDDTAVTFTHGQSLHLRFIMLDVINHYEVCLVPWKLGIVDNAEFEQQFRSLVDHRDGNYKLQKARQIIGQEKFPATEAFLKHLFPPVPPNAPKASIASA